MNKIEVVAAIIRNGENILCCQRDYNKLYYLSEKWEFPGGKIEEGENQEQALIREIYEELEIDIYDLKYALTIEHHYKDFELIMHAFNAKTIQIEFKLHAHKKAVWSDLNKLLDFDWAAADIPIVDYLKNE